MYKEGYSAEIAKEILVAMIQNNAFSFSHDDDSAVTNAEMVSKAFKTIYNEVLSITVEPF